MKIEARVTLTILDTPTRRVLSKRSFKSRSYVIAFLDGLAVHMRELTANIRDAGNTLRSVAPFTFYNDAKALNDQDDYGLVVGTGTNAVALADYALQAQISHGVGAGQLNYQASESTAPVTIGTKRRFLLTRSFVNESGGSITANECGIYVRCTVTPYYFMTVRDIISGGEVVPDTTTLVIQYEVYIEV